MYTSQNSAKSNHTLYEYLRRPQMIDYAVPEARFQTANLQPGESKGWPHGNSGAVSNLAIFPSTTISASNYITT